MTIQSASGADVTHLVAPDPGRERLSPVILISSSRVTIQGFTILGTPELPAVVVVGGERASINKNVIRGAATGILLTGNAGLGERAPGRDSLLQARIMGNHTISGNSSVETLLSQIDYT